MTGVERVGEEFGFAGESYRVRLQGAGAPTAVIAKLWSLSYPDDDREIRFYRELAPDMPTRLPAFHHGGADHGTGRGWLVLEELVRFRQGDDLVDEPLDVVLDLVDTMATVHAAWWNRVGDRTWLTRAPRLRRDAEYLADRRAVYLQRFGPIADPVTARLFDEIPALVEVATGLLAGAPETLLHQDIGLDNVLFLSPDGRPVPIDWAHAGRGPGVHDLATILFCTAAPDDVAAAVDHYLAALRRARVDAGPGDVRRWLTGAMIHEFVTRTLGVARWRAGTPRGLQILDRGIARTPHVVAAWFDLDPLARQHLQP